jgi:uncharacterized protein YggT (Ycf19 family)
MVHNPKLAADEARRSTEHASMKSELAGAANDAIAREARHELADERAEVAAVGRQLEHRAVREVGETEREVSRTRWSARAAQIVDYLFMVIYLLVVIQIVLEASGARDSNGFKGLMDTLSYPFLAPIRGLFADPSIGEYRFMFSDLAALALWIVVHLMIRGLLRVIGRRQTTL